MKLMLREVATAMPNALAELLLLLASQAVTGAVVRRLQAMPRVGREWTSRLRGWRPSPLATWGNQREW